MFDTAETAWEMEEARARLRGGGDGGGYGGGDDDERGWSASREVAREAAERDAMHAGDVDEDGDVDDGIVAEMTRLASLRAKAEREEEREAAAAKAREEAEAAAEAARAAEEVRALRASVAAAAKLHAAKRWGVAKQLATDAVAKTPVTRSAASSRKPPRRRSGERLRRVLLSRTGPHTSPSAW
jgi:hypothetical protein